MDFDHLWNLEERGVAWVKRAKENLEFEVVESYPVKADGKIVFHELVGLKNAGSRNAYPDLMRRVVLWVEVHGKQRLMTFLTNHLTWSAESIAELYCCRRRIEVFFKQIKQTLQLADFLGTSANAVRWQVWTAWLVYLLLRYLAFLSNWSHSFSRLFAVVRTCLWRKWDLLNLLGRYGTAAGSFGCLGGPEQAFSRVCVNLWDSQLRHDNAASADDANKLKFLNAARRGQLISFGKSRITPAFRGPWSSTLSSAAKVLFFAIIGRKKGYCWPQYGLNGLRGSCPGERHQSFCVGRLSPTFLFSNTLNFGFGPEEGAWHSCAAKP